MDTRYDRLCQVSERPRCRLTLRWNLSWLYTYWQLQWVDRKRVNIQLQLQDLLETDVGGPGYRLREGWPRLADVDLEGGKCG